MRRETVERPHVVERHPHGRLQAGSEPVDEFGVGRARFERIATRTHGPVQLAHAGQPLELLFVAEQSARRKRIAELSEVAARGYEHDAVAHYCRRPVVSEGEISARHDGRQNDGDPVSNPSAFHFRKIFLQI